MQLNQSALVAGVCGLLSCTPSLAHHGAPGFDFQKPVTLEGRIIEVQWKNPHMYFTLGTNGVDGKPRVLEIEAASPPQVVAFGMPRGTLKPGLQVRVVAFGRLKNPDGADYKGATVTLPDGVTYLLENSGRAAPVRQTVAARALSGRWVPASARNFGEYMQAEAKARKATASGVQAALDAQAGNFTNTCANIARESLSFMMAASGGLRTIDVGARAVVLRIDAGAGVIERTVDLVRKVHPANVAPTPHGHSIGSWEGKTLVIDTAAFAAYSVFPLQQGARRHMIERLTLEEGGHHLRYEFTVEDPDYYPQPLRFSMQWTHRPDIEMSGAPCDDENARKFLSVK